MYLLLLQILRDIFKLSAKLLQKYQIQFKYLITLKIFVIADKFNYKNTFCECVGGAVFDFIYKHIHTQKNKYNSTFPP